MDLLIEQHLLVVEKDQWKANPPNKKYFSLRLIYWVTAQTRLFYPGWDRGQEHMASKWAVQQWAVRSSAVWTCYKCYHSRRLSSSLLSSPPSSWNRYLGLSAEYVPAHIIVNTPQRNTNTTNSLGQKQKDWDTAALYSLLSSTLLLSLLD